MAKQEKIGILHASMLIITAIGILDHVIIIPFLLEAAGRDSWLSVLLAGVLLLVWILLVYYIMRHSGQQHVFLWLRSHLGAYWAWLIMIIIAIDLFIMIATTLRDVAYWTNVTYLTSVPNIVLVACYALVSFYVASSGLRPLAIVNGILLPIVVVLGFLVATSNLPHKDYSLLFPILEHGHPPLLLGMLYAGAGFSGFFYLVYMQHRLQHRIKLLPLIITGIILVELTLSPLTGAIAAFGPEEASRMRFPSFEQWRLITFVHSIEHIDFFSVYQWLVGAFIRAALGLFLIPELFNLVEGKTRTRFLIAICVLVIAATQIPVDDLVFLSFLSIYLPISLCLMLLVSVVMTIVAWNQRRKVKA